VGIEMSADTQQVLQQQAAGLEFVSVDVTAIRARVKHMPTVSYAAGKVLIEEARGRKSSAAARLYRLAIGNGTLPCKLFLHTPKLTNITDLVEHFDGCIHRDPLNDQAISERMRAATLLKVCLADSSGDWRSADHILSGALQEASSHSNSGMQLELVHQALQLWTSREHPTCVRFGGASSAACVGLLVDVLRKEIGHIPPSATLHTVVEYLVLLQKCVARSWDLSCWKFLHKAFADGTELLSRALIDSSAPDTRPSIAQSVIVLLRSWLLACSLVLARETGVNAGTVFTALNVVQKLSMCFVRVDVIKASRQAVDHGQLRAAVASLHRALVGLSIHRTQSSTSMPADGFRSSSVEPAAPTVFARGSVRVTWDPMYSELVRSASDSSISVPDFPSAAQPGSAALQATLSKASAVAALHTHVIGTEVEIPWQEALCGDVVSFSSFVQSVDFVEATLDAEPLF